MRMRHALALAVVPVVLLALTACGDGFAQAQKANTIEAFEQYLADNPGGRFEMEATAQLETLYLADAREKKTLEAYDRYLQRFPKGDLRDKALAGREEFLFEDAKARGTVEAWDQFLTEYPKADKKRAKEAERGRDMASYAAHVTTTPVVVDRVNMAEDPKGPKDGWGFTTEVTNTGDRTLTELRLTLSFLADDGRTLVEKEWPVVAKTWPIPMEEEKKVPMKPGQTRTWLWTDSDVPAPWLEGAKKVSVRPTRVVFAE